MHFVVLQIGVVVDRSDVLAAEEVDKNRLFHRRFGMDYAKVHSVMVEEEEALHDKLVVVEVACVPAAKKKNEK